MSLPGTPHSSSGGDDDFAALLDLELQAEESDHDEEEEEEGGDHTAAAAAGVVVVADEDKEHENGAAAKEEEPAARRNAAECPPHPGFMGGMCIRCGALRGPSEAVEDGVALRYIHAKLELSKSEAARLRNNELQKLKERRKLYLVLDLDHTLLNSARFTEVPPEEEAYCTSAYAFQASSGLGKGERKANGTSGTSVTLHKLLDLQMWTKLRPYVHRFLEEASKFFEMYVYTMGERMYALAMARLLDPSGRFFGERVISQGDSTLRTAKNLDVVLGAESAVVILDDTEGVWPNHGANLVVMERYHFFCTSRRQFGVQAKSLTEAHRDESEADGTLATVLQTLLKVHHNFFNTPPLPGSHGRHGDPFASKDVTKILRQMRSEILKGCSIVFSRVYPTTLPSTDGHGKESYEAESNEWWRLSEKLGAKCSRTIESTTTHVVATDNGTEKARWARSNKLFLVNPRWVEAAQYLWRKPDEQDFPVAAERTVHPVGPFSKTVEVHAANGPQNVLVQELDGQPMVDDIDAAAAKKRCLDEVSKEDEALGGGEGEKQSAEELHKKRKV